MPDEGRQPPQMPPPMPPYDPAQWTPQPPPEPPARGRGRKVLIIIGIVVFVLAALGTGGYLLVRNVLKGAEQMGARVAEPVLIHMRDGDYAAIAKEASPEFQAATNAAQLTAILSGVEKAVGRPVSWKLTGFETQAYTGTDGATSTRTFHYDVTNEHGKSEVTIRVGKDDKLLYLNVNPLGQ